jgi:hypothetical protein
MQSTGSKSKRSSESAEDLNATASQAAVTAAEETTKVRRKAPAKKAAAETTSAAKQHRGAAKKAPVPAAGSSISTSAAASHTDIATLAYSYWAQRGYQGGSAEEDWLRAERHLLSRQ